ncbi:hypothetical protein E2C01_066893 [Portunus trituberculatus]|uniref:Uncharacterized protein n=1 Tax=Portunus trituberculatus TaxID=210409 RepID=A0A5B7HIC9_PORTR|nr:hypothetical protein [Portunus trituberculatus]
MEKQRKKRQTKYDTLSDHTLITDSYHELPSDQLGYKLFQAKTKMYHYLTAAWCLGMMLAVTGSPTDVVKYMRGAECYPYHTSSRKEMTPCTFHIPYTNVRPQEDFRTHYDAATTEMLIRYNYDLVFGYPSILLRCRNDNTRNMTSRDCLIEKWLSNDRKQHVIYSLADLSYNLHREAYLFTKNASIPSYVVRCPGLPLFYMRRAT